jgi:predicted nucleic acid-binding protein
LRLYLEPSVLVKLFKTENGSAKMVDVLSAVDRHRKWYACTSRWSLLEIARALRKDGKPRELIELNLGELRRHKIHLIELSRNILSQAESIVASHDVYTSDALHAATFAAVSAQRRLGGMLSEDTHFQRLGDIVKVLMLRDVTIEERDPPT